MLKKILIGIAIVIAIPLVAALFINGEYTVERSVTIDRPIDQVFDYIKYLQNQDNFSTWSSIDPDMEKTFTGTDGTVGFVSAWSSENPDVGVGEQEIMAIDEGKRIDYELRFIEPFEATSPAWMTTAAVDGGTEVAWGFDGKLDYPMNLMMLFVDFEETLGNDFQNGLDKLKEILEDMPEPEEEMAEMEMDTTVSESQ